MRRGLAFSWALLAGACTIDPTQLAVFVSSDFAEGDLGAVAIGVVGPDGEEHDAGTFPLGESDQRALPVSFGVAPRGGDPNRRVEVRVSGLAPGRAQPLLTTRAITSLGRWLRVLSSEATTNVVDAATDGATGAVVMAATGSGRFALDDRELGDRGGASILVHRFLP